MRMFVGYSNGTLESRHPSSLAKISSINLKSKVLSMVSDDKTLYIGLQNGSILYIQSGFDDNSKVETL